MTTQVKQVTKTISVNTQVKQVRKQISVNAKAYLKVYIKLSSFICVVEVKKNRTVHWSRLARLIVFATNLDVNAVPDATLLDSLSDLLQ